jgi:hypothetical protein
MMQVTLHPAPRPREIVREQIRIVGLSLRREALVAAVVLGVLSLVISINIIQGTAASWFDSDEWTPFVFIAFLFPFAVWRREKRFGPAFLWTLPVDRRQLALAKVFAGWVWLMIALAIFTGVQLVLAIASRLPEPKIVSPIAFPGATATYLFGSALVLGLRHPVRWLLGCGGLAFLIGFLNDSITRSRDPLGSLLTRAGFFAAVDNTLDVLGTLPGFLQWAIPVFLSLAAGLAALWAAASRHRERRRD